jgi:hypothetical protein
MWTSGLVNPYAVQGDGTPDNPFLYANHGDADNGAKWEDENRPHRGRYAVHGLTKLAAQRYTEIKREYDLEQFTVREAEVRRRYALRYGDGK